MLENLIFFLKKKNPKTLESLNSYPSNFRRRAGNLFILLFCFSLSPLLMLIAR